MSDSAPESGVMDAARKAAEGSKFGLVSPGEAPSGAALWSAVGKSRGLVESLAPGVGFLAVYTVTADVFVSVAAPVVMAVLFIAARLVMRSPVVPAIAGLVGITASALVALSSGRAEDNFILGFWVNAVWIAALVVSVVVKRPLVGWIAAVLRGNSGWREDAAIRRIGLVATWMWAGIFGARLAVQLPLYAAGEVGALAIAKLVLGIPLYAAGLWFTWLFFRSVIHRERDQAE
ncbi:MAG: hypothetical protein ACJAV4_001211 [Pontimonas sp.]|jgi:hypothetical protein